MCSSDAFEEDAIRKANELDRDDHNALGALQFVAKALEVWFMLIATTLLYDVAMLFAKKGGGLPVGFMLTHLEFSDVRNLFNPLMWTAPIPHRHSASVVHRWRAVRLYLFAILAAFLTILTNLMGPGTAVLVLPTLQWIDTPYLPDQLFNGTGAEYFPGGDSYSFPGCDKPSLVAGNYSCTFDVYGSSLDAWANTAVSSMRQGQIYGGVNLGVSQEGHFDFTLNSTNAIIWVPNRQVLRHLSFDLEELADKIYGVPDGSVQQTNKYNNSLTTVLRRKGPSIGVNMGCYAGEMSTKEVQKDKYVKCFSGWTVDLTSYYTKCIQAQDGWARSTRQSSFSLVNTIPKQRDVNITSFFSERATFFNKTTDFGSGIGLCMDKNSKPCDWNKIFDTNLPDDLRNSSINVGVTVFSSNDGPTEDSVVWCDQTAYLGFPTYQYDTSVTSVSNMLNLIQLNNITNPNLKDVPLVVNPYWLLAAWSIEDEGKVDGNRPMAKELLRIIPKLYTPWDYNNLTKDQKLFLILQTYSLGQSMSMVNYFWGNATHPDGTVPNDADHPLLSRWTTLRVWAYGISGRTAKLGVAVVSAGAFCVLLRFVLGFLMRAHNHPPVELFVAALEHQHQHEFRGLKHPREWAKVRYTMDVGSGGKPSFLPDRNWGTPRIPNSATI